MIPSRALTRAGRAVPRTRPSNLNKRWQSSVSAPSTSPSSSSSAALVGALAGGTAALTVGYAWYHFSGAKTVVQTAKKTQQYAETAHSKFKQEIQDKAPNPSEALKWLRQTSTFYAGFVPGASGIVNKSFDDIEKIQEKHGDEVDKIVREAFDELKGITQKGISLETAQQTWDVLQKHVKRIGKLGGDAFEEIIDNHPQLKEAVGDNMTKLKALGDSSGPEAKKLFEQTRQQIQEISEQGISTDSVDKIRKLVLDKVEQIQKLGDEAWQQGLEQAKPYLDKSPQIKNLIESNADSLKQGNLSELWAKVKEAAETRDVNVLKQYVDNAIQKTTKDGSSLGDMLGKIPGADQVLPRLGQLQTIAQSKGPEAQKLLEQTVQEITEVLSKKAEEAKKLASEAKSSTN